MEIRKQDPLARGAGILLAVSSLPSPHGIGTFGDAAYGFVDFLSRAGQRYWQVLPLVTTGYGDSPYQSFSAFAGNPYYIDLDDLTREGLLKPGEADASPCGDEPWRIDYALLYEHRAAVLKRAFMRMNPFDAGFLDFCARRSPWLDDYALFMALKTHYGGGPWTDWPEAIRRREPYALAEARQTLEEDIQFWKFCEYKGCTQWLALKSYAGEKGIQIIGDMPIYVSMDSADVWVHPHLFQLDKNLNPLRVAGVPPDSFSETGQLWGTPLYDWGNMEAEDFSWWRQRVHLYAELYDIVRIDHFIGIAQYYAIPAGETTAENGLWMPGPGEKLIAAISEAMDGKQIIAEDLGAVTPQVRHLQALTGYPGMRLYQMAFDSDRNNLNLPEFYDGNTIAYGGTHDNDTLVGYFEKLEGRELAFALEYLGVSRKTDIPWEMIRTAYASSAAVVIFQMQDYLGLGSEARMNIPSTLSGNWQWRLLAEQVTSELERRLYAYARRYGRL